MRIDVIDYGPLYIGIFLQHIEQHSPSAHKGFNVGDIILASECIRQE